MLRLESGLLRHLDPNLVRTLHGCLPKNREIFGWRYAKGPNLIYITLSYCRVHRVARVNVSINRLLVPSAALLLVSYIRSSSHDASSGQTIQQVN